MYPIKATNSGKILFPEPQVVALQTNGQTDGRTDRRYQVHYLPRFVVDNEDLYDGVGISLGTPVGGLKGCSDIGNLSISRCTALILIIAYMHSSKYLFLPQGQVGHFSIQHFPSCFNEIDQG